MPIDAYDLTVETSRGDVCVRVLPGQPLGAILTAVMAEFDIPSYSWPEYDLVTGPGEPVGPRGLNETIADHGLEDGDRVRLDVNPVGGI